MEGGGGDTSEAVEDEGGRADVAIVGGGPIGLELAVALRRLPRPPSVLHFEARQIGHTMTWWAPGTRFFSSNERIAIAGVPLITPDGGKATREQYLAYLRTVVTLHGLSVRTYERVTEVRREGEGLGDGFVVRTERRGEAGGGGGGYRVGSVVLATGGTERARRLGVAGEDLPHVSHYFTEPHQYFGQRLLIVGGRNSAAEAALRCHHAGAHVTLSYRGAGLPEKSIKYWLLPELQGLIESGRIRAMYGTTPVEFGPGRAELRRGDGSVESVGADFVLLLVGYEADMTLFETAGVTLAPGTRAPRFDPATMETDVRGLFVAGTAIAGTQERYEVFIENSHVHVERIVAALQGRRATAAEPVYAQPES